MSEWTLYGTKAQQLAQLKAKLYEKRAIRAATTNSEKKAIQQPREKPESREDLQRKDQLKEAQQHRKEKLEEMAAKKRVKDKIEADKNARKAKAEEQRRMREARGETFSLGGARPSPQWYDRL